MHEFMNLLIHELNGMCINMILHIKDIDITFVITKIFCLFCRYLPTFLNRASGKKK